MRSHALLDGKSGEPCRCTWLLGECNSLFEGDGEHNIMGGGVMRKGGAPNSGRLSLFS